MKNTKHLFGVLICILGAIYYSYEYFLRISPSVMEGALRLHFGLNATGLGCSLRFIIMPMCPCRCRLVFYWIATAQDSS